MMFGRKLTPTEKFWRWLADHRHQIHAELLAGGDPRSQHWSITQLGQYLRAVNADLVHEIGMADPATIELIISADGIKARFPAVTALVAAAPKLDGFKITGFRPRCGDGFQLHVAGHVITDDWLTYRLLPDREAFGIEVFIDGELTPELRTMAGFLSLDQRLGEYDVATGLTWIEFQAGRPSDALPITGLARDFDARRKLVRH